MYPCLEFSVNFPIYLSLLSRKISNEQISNVITLIGVDTEAFEFCFLLRNLTCIDLGAHLEKLEMFFLATCLVNEKAK